MKTRKITLAAFISVLLLLSFACSIPALFSKPSINDQAATLVAMTMRAFTPGTSEKTLQAIQPVNTPTQITTNELTVTVTPTSSTPTLKVDEATNCRSGPGSSYEVVTTVQTGISSEIVGRSQDSTWWLINNPFGSGTCWISDEFATVSGSDSTVKVATPPAPATASLPKPPSISSWDYFCSYGSSGPNVTFNLKWSDRAVDETGYRIYRNNELVTELAPNSASFSEVVDVESNEQLTYRLEVYNGAGASSASPISFSCQ